MSTKKKACYGCLIAIIFVSFLAIIIPPFTLYATKTLPLFYYDDLEPLDEVSYRNTNRSASVCINTSCSPLNSECAESFTMYKYSTTPGNKTFSYGQVYDDIDIPKGYFAYDCREASRNGGVEYTFSSDNAIPSYIFDYDSFQKFKRYGDTFYGTLVATTTSGTYEWRNSYSYRITQCFVMYNRYNQESVRAHMEYLVKNYWYDVSTDTADEYCKGQYCCFNSVGYGDYIVIHHDYDQSSTATALVNATITIKDGLSAAGILFIFFGSISFCFFTFVLVVALCSHYRNRGSSGSYYKSAPTAPPKPAQSTYSSSYTSSSSSSSSYKPSYSSSSSSYKPSYKPTSYRRIPDAPSSVPSVKKTSASDYSAARANAPSSVSSITVHVTVTEAISRVRPDNVEVDLYEFARLIPSYDTEECRNARKLCEMAESGDVEAIYLFGMCFKEGIAVSRDYRRAAQLFLIAAEKGNDDAVYELGFAFEKGNGVGQDYSKAVILYQAAALEGCTDAMVRLGFFYLDGLGIEEDHVKAIQLWIIAAAAGNKMAEAILEAIQEALNNA